MIFNVKTEMMKPPTSLSKCKASVTMAREFAMYPPTISITIRVKDTKVAVFS